MSGSVRRIRDPIHGLILFDETDWTDQVALKLIDTPEFQRLRRIRQLGVSEFVYPGATHTRFAHSLGVYHNARRLLSVIRRKRPDDFDEDRATTVQLAALLHDVGHGPFSHAFESAREALAKRRQQHGLKKHEWFSAALIRGPDTGIATVLEEAERGLADKIAQVIVAETPKDIYGAVVSSSFDADRLDYLVRDRYMTGTGTGAIDLDWLLDNLDIAEIEVAADSDDAEEAEASRIDTFVFKDKARAAAEDFLLARYRLFSTVYLHKTTRGFECLTSGFINWLGTDGNARDSGLDTTHPLIGFLLSDEPAIEPYTRLDDLSVWGLIHETARRDRGLGGRLATALLNRQRPRPIDLRAAFDGRADLLKDTDRRLQDRFRDRLDRTVFRDTASLSLYAERSGESAKIHKRIRIRTAHDAKHIIDFDDTIISNTLRNKRETVRYYFMDRDDEDEARRILDGRD